MLLYKILPIWLWKRIAMYKGSLRSIRWSSIRIFHKNQRLPRGMYTAQKRDGFSKWAEPKITFEHLSVVYERDGRYLIRPVIAPKLYVDVIRIECDNAAIKFIGPKGGSGGVALLVTPVMISHEAFVLTSLIASIALIMVIL